MTLDIIFVAKPRFLLKILTNGMRLCGIFSHEILSSYINKYVDATGVHTR